MTPSSWLLGGHDDPYRRFTDDCNARAPVVILSSGQACVWYRLTLASKDGDWIVREDEEALETVLDQLNRRGARYRLGAPLDLRWLTCGWSSHFEAVTEDGMRLRFDFVSRPPRLAPSDLLRLWQQVAAGAPAVVPILDLIALKRTMRLKDYAFIGGLSLRLSDPADQLRTTVDAEHFISLLRAHPDLLARLPALRPTCAGIPMTVEAVAEAIDAEIRQARAADESRIRAYTEAMAPWASRFRAMETDRLSLKDAHKAICAAAEECLPREAPWP